MTPFEKWWDEIKDRAVIDESVVRAAWEVGQERILQELRLEHVQELQTEFWDAIRALEAAGIAESATDGIADWEGLDLDTLLAMSEEDDEE